MITQEFHLLPKMEKESECGAATWSRSSGGRSSWQLSSSQRERKWLSGGRRSLLSPLYRAEVRPQWGRRSNGSRCQSTLKFTSSHYTATLSTSQRCQGGEAESGDFRCEGSLCELCFRFPLFSRRFSQVQREDAAFVLLPFVFSLFF